MTATIKDVAQRAGVSITTVSRVLNTPELVQPDTASRVRSSMVALGYTPNVVARTLRRHESTTIGVVVPDGRNPFYAEMVAGIEAIAVIEGFSVLVCYTDDNPARAERCLELLHQQRAAGIIIASPGAFARQIRALGGDGVPIVLADRGMIGADTDSVSSDNRAGGAQAIAHLLALGHTRIGMIVGRSTTPTSKARVEGAYHALETAGLPRRRIQGVAVPDFRPSTGYDGAEYLLNEVGVRAIFALNDSLAFGAVAFAAQHWRVPHDVSIIGFDDVPLAAYYNPPLTTICQQAAQIGTAAAERLFARIGGDSSPVETLILPTQLMVRGTTAPMG